MGTLQFITPQHYVIITVRVWVPVFVRTGSIVDYWREPGLRHIPGAAVLNFDVCIVALCSLFILLSQYIMPVHFANSDLSV